MPYVNVKITKGPITKEQKAQLVQEITTSLQTILNKKPEQTNIVIELVDEENWGFAGKLVADK
ncbi:MAG: tautomerase family protein [Trueperaceae bacterium]